MWSQRQGCGRARAALLALGVAWSCGAAPESDEPAARDLFEGAAEVSDADRELLERARASELPRADELLESVRARLPSDPILIKGRLLTRADRGGEQAGRPVRVLLDLGREPSTAQYTLLDDAGEPAERLTVLRRRDGSAPRYVYERGAPLRPADMPDLGACVAGTDFTWHDLTLEFLWWTGGKTEGHDRVKGRDCFVVTVPIPRPEGGATDAQGAAASGRAVSLWIDVKFRMVLRAEERAESGEPRRRLSVKSFKKIGERWMLKNIEVRTVSTRSRTVLEVDEAEALNR